MQNLRVVPQLKYVDSYATGDYHSYNVYNVVRDFTECEKAKFNYSDSVIKNGIIIETFRSEENANIFVEALKSISI